MAAGKGSEKKVGGIGEGAVKAATGRTWDAWIALLDKAGAKTMTHQEIVAVVGGERGVGPWWQQMVTVGYEQARGMRKKHEKPEGFQISRSKTIAAPVATVFRAWKDKSVRKEWLKGDWATLRKATVNKSLRATWDRGATSLDVDFYPKGSGKTQVTVQHRKLTSAGQAEKMKSYWGKNLDRLKDLLEA